MAKSIQQRNIEEQVKLAAPARRALAAAGIQSLQQLSRFSEQEVANLHGIGKNALDALKGAMKAEGLSFKK